VSRFLSDEADDWPDAGHVTPAGRSRDRSTDSEFSCLDLAIFEPTNEEPPPLAKATPATVATDAVDFKAKEDAATATATSTTPAERAFIYRPPRPERRRDALRPTQSLRDKLRVAIRRKAPQPPTVDYDAADAVADAAADDADADQLIDGAPPPPTTTTPPPPPPPVEDGPVIEPPRTVVVYRPSIDQSAPAEAAAASANPLPGKPAETTSQTTALLGLKWSTSSQRFRSPTCQIDRSKNQPLECLYWATVAVVFLDLLFCCKEHSFERL